MSEPGSNIQKAAESDYQARVPIYPRSVKGRFRTLKYAILLLAYGVYFLLPWVRWHRTIGPDQAVLFDLAGRKFYLFGLVVYPQDIFWLAGFLVIAAMLLFFVTGLAGRVFCGYFCFQTLWTDVFMFIERMVQGERNARIKLAKAPWTAAKAFKLGLTHLLWLTVGLLTGMTFTFYWGNAPDLLSAMLHGTAPFPAYATTLFLTATTYVMAGLAREQVCTYMCPYARFQSAMFDPDTLIVAYDERRGEGAQGRAKPKAGLKTREERTAAGHGDCIDCGYCVQVCPTGIDIRNGLQPQCISCALCIDACDTIMDSIGYPRGLVRYSSQVELAEGRKPRWLKLKTIGYGVVILVAATLLVLSIVHRTTVEMTVRQVRNPLSVLMSDGQIQNRYEIKVMNKTAEDMHYVLSLQGLKNAVLDVGNFKEFELEPQATVHIVARVRQYPRDASGVQQDFYFIAQPVEAEHDPKAETIKWKSVFYVPKAQLKSTP
ncbi:MAG TPA: cytochrome c oxidase accessory protein CcoG [Gammaproteobacteria bacterium]|nr:cytochrome c oxidase accessory protein CcoG [Gammaproteobacteria bacterium]